MQSYGLSDEMIAYIKANGRCEEDKIRFIWHSQGEFDNTDRKAPTSPDTQNVFHPIQVDESAVKSSTLAFWEDALKSLQSQLGEATDEGVKTSLEKDIMKAKEQISQLQK
jgi:DNA polymerase III sliding clamp (beta) subunit (PCNA family)